jgi:hypothetical protein
LLREDSQKGAVAEPVSSRKVVSSLTEFVMFPSTIPKPLNKARRLLVLPEF